MKRVFYARRNGIGKMIKLTRPLVSQETINRVVKVLESGCFSQGRYVRRLERGFEKYLGVRHAIAVSSGTAALHLALMALGIGAGDEVVVPAFTFPATANAVELAGAKPVFVDISLDDYCIDPSRIEERLTSRTRAILPVHEFGQPADMDAILRIAGRHRLAVIEDAACAIGASYRGRKTGALGEIGCFSLHPRKVVTCGEGGVIAVNSDRLAERLRALRNQGAVKTPAGVDFRYAGLNCRLTEFQAVIALGQLSAINSLLEKRRSLAQVYNRELGGLRGIAVPSSFADRKMTFQSYHILLDKRISRARLQQYLLKAGIETGLGAQALHCQSYYRKKYGFNARAYPNAYRSFCSGMVLPIGSHVGKAEARSIARKISAFVERGGV